MAIVAGCEARGDDQWQMNADKRAAAAMMKRGKK